MRLLKPLLLSILVVVPAIARADGIDGMALCLVPSITINVDTVADTAADDGVTSLREGIARARANPQCDAGWDTINLALPIGAVITLSDGLDLGDDRVRIVGNGAVTLRSSKTSEPLFDIGRTSQETDVIFSRLTLDGASVARTQPAIRAGAGTKLTLDRVVIQDFDAGTSAPGAIDADGVAGLQIVDSALLENRGSHASRPGGGAVNLAAAATGGVFSIVRSTFLLNETVAGSSGGALLSQLPVGVGLLIDSSTFAGNVAGMNGGGLAHSGGPLTVVNSTFSANEAGAAGGGIRVAGDGLSIRHATIVVNTAGSGGGLAVPVGVPVVGTHNIVSLNTASVEDDNLQLDASLSSLAYSLVDMSAFMLNLGELGLYGGSLPVHMPLPGSAAINTGEASVITAPARDQRGVARVQGADIDIGAVEVVVATGDDDGGGVLSWSALAGLGLLLLRRRTARR
ncbi:MAG: choice-of-anchor Q domain-containing protein [Pseudomonadota bacterium]